MPEPGPVTDRHRPDILHQDRDAIFLGQHHILDVVSLYAPGSIHPLPPSSIRPTPRMLMDCWPIRISRPPTLTFALPKADRI